VLALEEGLLELKSKAIFLHRLEEVQSAFRVHCRLHRKEGPLLFLFQFPLYVLLCMQLIHMHLHLGISSSKSLHATNPFKEKRSYVA